MVSLFMAKISVHVQNSIINIPQNRYDDQFLQKVWKIEKFDFKYKQAELNRGILLTCKDENVTPNILNLKLSYKQPQSSKGFLICHKQLLNKEIGMREKKSALRMRSSSSWRRNKRNVKYSSNCLSKFQHCNKFVLQPVKSSNLVLVWNISYSRLFYLQKQPKKSIPEQRFSWNFKEQQQIGKIYPKSMKATCEELVCKILT